MSFEENRNIYSDITKIDSKVGDVIKIIRNRRLNNLIGAT